jgi:two-component system KDP operon response regulator KdpE
MSSRKEMASGLEYSDDDCVTWPFPSKAREAVEGTGKFHTGTWEEHLEPVFRSGDLVVDFAHHQVTLARKRVDVTFSEYKLLCYLILNAGRLATYDQILEEVWGQEYVGENTILRVNITRLRHKLGDNAKQPRFIANRVGMGYQFLQR